MLAPTLWSATPFRDSASCYRCGGCWAFFLAPRLSAGRCAHRVGRT